MQVTPVFHKIREAYNTKQYNVFVLEGGSRCFGKDQRVITKRGHIPISKIKKGDFVLSFNEETQKNEFRKVVDVMAFNNTKPTVKIRLKNGEEIICTEDHKFYHKGKWIEIKDILKELKQG